MRRWFQWKGRDGPRPFGDGTQYVMWTDGGARDRDRFYAEHRLMPDEWPDEIVVWITQADLTMIEDSLRAERWVEVPDPFGVLLIIEELPNA